MTMNCAVLETGNNKLLRRTKELLPIVSMLSTSDPAGATPCTNALSPDLSFYHDFSCWFRVVVVVVVASFM